MTPALTAASPIKTKQEEMKRLSKFGDDQEQEIGNKQTQFIPIERPSANSKSLSTSLRSFESQDMSKCYISDVHDIKGEYFWVWVGWTGKLGVDLVGSDIERIHVFGWLRKNRETMESDEQLIYLKREEERTVPLARLAIPIRKKRVSDNKEKESGGEGTDAIHLAARPKYIKSE